MTGNGRLPDNPGCSCIQGWVALPFEFLFDSFSGLGCEMQEVGVEPRLQTPLNDGGCDE